MFGVELWDVFGGLIAVALLVYALTAGADFGGGVWDLLASGPRRQAQRALIAHAIGPIWEANHVWMILVVVLLFVAFPTGFAAIMTALHVPIAAMLVGITLRGASFVFRAYAPPSGRWSRWGAVFAVSSVATPLLLGVVLGAVASGALHLDAQRTVVTDYVSEWLAPFPWALGIMVLALCAYLAASYLAVQAEDAPLREDFRRRALFANVAFGLAAAAAGWTAHKGAPALWTALTGSPLAWLMQGALAGVALAASAALLGGRVVAARALSMVQVTLVVGGWVAAQRGWLLVGALTLRQAAAPPSVLAPVLGVLGLGSLALVPSFVWLYRLFAFRRDRP